MTIEMSTYVEKMMKNNVKILKNQKFLKTQYDKKG